MPFFIMLILSIGFSEAHDQFETEIKKFEGKVGKGYVDRGDGRNPERGECHLQVDRETSYTSVWLKIKYDYGNFFDSKFIAKTYQEGQFKVFEAKAYDDDGELCGSWAPGKKVIERILFSASEVKIERSYKCPYFFTRTKEFWLCRF